MTSTLNFRKSIPRFSVLAALIGCVAFGLFRSVDHRPDRFSRTTLGHGIRPVDFHPLSEDLLSGGRDWINTAAPIRLADLRGKIVLLDFWTYCCINCHHILPDLAYLEEKYKDEIVVIGVHTGKFEAEKDSDNIRKKVLEYRIKHPVINDADQVLWNRFGAMYWPTIVLIDAKGSVVGKLSGEGHRKQLDAAIGTLVRKQKSLIDPKPLKFQLESDKKPRDGVLQYPGKVTADPQGKRLFISDTGHNRILVTDLEGKGIASIGNGATGFKDGGFDQAMFNRPQGTCLVGETLYVADTENHAIRAIDLRSKRVSTASGHGAQSNAKPRAAEAKRAGLSSPWDIAQDPSFPHILYIAMAGCHQIWHFDTKKDLIGVWAGTSSENIADGPITRADFAQPSGLTVLGRDLFVADSEGSCVREISLGRGAQAVRTVVGAHDIPGVLFAFGDGEGAAVGTKKLQHCLGVASAEGKVYIADTYNNKIKVYDPNEESLKTLAGSLQAGDSDDPATFDEPGGLSAAGGNLYIADTNNHAVRVIDLAARKTRTLKLTGLKPPTLRSHPPVFSNPTVLEAAPVKIAPGGTLTLNVSIQLAPGIKVNPDAPMPYLLETPGKTGILDAGVSPFGSRVEPPSDHVRIAVPIAKDAREGETFDLRLSLASFQCKEGVDGFCRVNNFVWNVPVRLSGGVESSVSLSTVGLKSAK